MAKRQRLSSSKGNTKPQVKLESEDRISRLPDALLVSILCLLTLKESVATSVLSRRWRNVWTLVPRLDFDGSNSLQKIEMAEDKQLAIHVEMSKYIRWVDHVLSLHESSAVEEFRVYFNLSKSYERYIDKWIEYALARKVKRLELDLIGILRVGDVGPHDACYSFPLYHSSHFKYLEKVSLNFVSVDGEALEFFLSNCPLLRHLVVSKSKELLTLKIVGPFPSLKFLEIISCSNLNSVEIRDTNLVYLKYIGTSIQHVLLNNLPLLVEMHIEGRMEMSEVLEMFSSIFPQLERLIFKFGCFLSWEVTEMFYANVKMSNLKQLVLYPIYETYRDNSLLPVSNILRASPCLESLVLMLWDTKIRKKALKKLEGCSYAHLKEVIVRGYCGSVPNLEMVMHLYESAAALKKIIIDPRFSSDTCNKFWQDYFICREKQSRARAKKQLVRKLSSTINLQIL